MAYDRAYSIGLPNAQGPLVVSQPLILPDNSPELCLEAWLSNFGGSNVHLIRNVNSVADALGILEAGYDDILMTVPSGGVARVRLREDVRSVSAYFESTNNSGQTQVVTFRIYEEYRR